MENLANNLAGISQDCGYISFEFLSQSNELI